MLTWVLLLAIDGGTPTEGGAAQRPKCTAGEAEERRSPECRQQPAVLSAEDQEVVDNLELLQELDSAADLELLEELGKD